MSDSHDVSDASSTSSDLIDLVSYKAMFYYDNLCLHYITREDPGYSKTARKNSRLTVYAIQEAWREA